MTLIAEALEIGEVEPRTALVDWQYMVHYSRLDNLSALLTLYAERMFCKECVAASSPLVRGVKLAICVLSPTLHHPQWEVALSCCFRYRWHNYPTSVVRNSIITACQ